MSQFAANNPLSRKLQQEATKRISKFASEQLAKNGPKYLRWAMLEAALHACRHTAYRDRYQTTKKRLYAWLRYVQTTSDGIKNWWGAVTALDDANIRINGSVVDLEIENNGTQVCRFTDTDIYMYRDDGATVAASTGQGIIWESGKVYIAETGVSGLTASESNQLTDAAAAAVVASRIPYTIQMDTGGVVKVNIKKVNDITISGSGTVASPWGP